MKRVWIVDDDPAELEGYRRMEAVMPPDWEIRYALGGENALESLNFEVPDAVVADFGMPGCNGAQFLEIVRTRCPLSVRLLVSGTFDWESRFRIFSTPHRYLAKPVDHAEMVAELDRALELRDRLTNPRLQNLVSESPALPSLPGVYLDLIRELDRPETSIDRLGEILGRDMSMCAQILRMANSPFFAIAHLVEDLHEAVQYLGLEIIRAMVLGLQIFSMFGRIQFTRFPFEQLWHHSWNVGMLARSISQLEEAPPPTVNESFLGGILHDIGKLILATGATEEYREVLVREADGAAAEEAEQLVVGCTHADLGAYLLALWGLPPGIVEAVARHHRPDPAAESAFSAITAVHAADAIRHHMDPPLLGGNRSIDRNYVKALGLDTHLKAWRNIADPHGHKPPHPPPQSFSPPGSPNKGTGFLSRSPQ